MSNLVLGRAPSLRARFSQNGSAGGVFCQSRNAATTAAAAIAAEIEGRVAAVAAVHGRSQYLGADVLQAFTTSKEKEELCLRGHLHLLRLIEPLEPSAYDERLHKLVEAILAMRHQLPLTAIVDVSRAVQQLRLSADLSSLVELAVQNADFLPSDALAGFAKRLFLSAHASGRLEALVSAETTAAGGTGAVFRMLSDQVRELAQDVSSGSASSDGSCEIYARVQALLPDAMLTLARFHSEASVRSPGLEALLPVGSDIFPKVAASLLGKSWTLPEKDSLKLLLAYCTWLQAPRQRLLLLEREEESVGHMSPEVELVFSLGGQLSSQEGILSAKEIVRGLHAFAQLHRRGLHADGRGVAFSSMAVRALEQQLQEMDVKDISFAIDALGVLVPKECMETSCQALLEMLYAAILEHVPSLGATEALRIARAAAVLRPVASPGTATELLAAELARELELSGSAILRMRRRGHGDLANATADPHARGGLSAEQICQTAVSFAALRHVNPDFVQRLASGLVPHMQDCPPSVLATTMHSLVKAGLRVDEDTVFREAAQSMTRNLIGYRPRDSALMMWAFARASRRNMVLFLAVQEDLKKQDLSEHKPEDVSMFLWSFARIGLRVDSDVLSGFVQNISRHSSSYSNTALLVTCLSLARLGFARQPILVQLYRGIYSRLPELRTSQVAFSFFLFATSGVRDEALLQRFVFECNCRVHQLRGQDLSNVTLACSRALSQANLQQPPYAALAASLHERVMTQLPELQKGPAVGVFLSAPLLLQLTEEEKLLVASNVARHFPDMDATELARCLLAAAKLEFAEKRFLLPLYHCLRPASEQLSAQELVSCIWAMHSLGFVKPRLQRRLGHELQLRVQRREVPVRTLSDILPALHELGFWEGLPLKLRSFVWKLASEDARGKAPAPPLAAFSEEPKSDEHEDPKRTFQLKPLRKGELDKRRRGPTWISRYHALQSVTPQSPHAEARRETEETPVEAYGTGRTALRDFVAMINRL